MILGDGENISAGQRPTLDDLFRRAGVRHPDRVALVDPPNRAAFTDGPPRSLTYAQADRAITAFAARLRAAGLATDTVVGVQLPNTVDGVIALIGVLRAGMIAAPLPLLWNARDITAALGRAGAKAIVTAARIGTQAKAEIAATVAADLFPVRFVGAFGEALPDGVVPLDDILAGGPPEPFTPPVRPDPAAAHVAAVTFETSADGIVPVARSHMEIIAGGMAVFLEASLEEDADIVSTIPPSTFAGLAASLVPWLISGGTLHLLHGFAAGALAAQSARLSGAALVLPGPAAIPLHDAGLIGTAFVTAIALRRAPQRLATLSRWRGDAALVDVACFGEVGIIVGKRGIDGLPPPLPRGLVNAPRGATVGVPQIETARTAAGTLALRGPMVPSAPFPPGAPAQIDSGSFWDTGYGCRAEDTYLAVTSPPAGTVAVGGYRFGLSELEALIATADPAATIVAVPDALAGERLAGRAADTAGLRAKLEENGINSLIIDAFRTRGKASAA